jgi:hypothetical protein
LNAEVLRMGHWPKNPDTTDDNNGQRRVKAEAAFEKPIIILAELEERLAKTKIRGKLLIAQVEAGRDFKSLDRDAKDALLYIKGFKRKRITFNEWKKARRYYQKGNKVSA